MTSIPATSKPQQERPAEPRDGARRRGSPWAGLGTVFAKELADHLSSVRMRVLEILILLIGLGAVYTAIQNIKTVTAEDPFLFLRLFTNAQQPLPSFAGLLGFLIPIFAIGLGFDSINTEFSRRTLSRILAQPIYRDALLFGKFLAGLVTLAVGLVALWLLMVGLGLLMIGVPPSGEEVLRSVAFLVTALAYAATWLAAAMLFSVLFRPPATSALCALGLWMLLGVLWPIVAPFIARAIVTPDPAAIVLGLPDPNVIGVESIIARVSPGTLFGEAATAILHPSTRALGLIYESQVEGALMGAPLPLGQSLLLVWPQITGLIAAAILLFAAAYVAFQRQEIRA
ncbi:MAG: ABC transporter permease subunit [Dongia sp.]